LGLQFGAVGELKGQKRGRSARDSLERSLGGKGEGDVEEKRGAWRAPEIDSQVEGARQLRVSVELRAQFGILRPETGSGCVASSEGGRERGHKSLGLGAGAWRGGGN